MSFIKKIKRINFVQVLGIISIIGFIPVIVLNSVGIEINNWVNSLIFIIFGSGLMVVAGWKFFIKRFKNGLTKDELSKTITIVVGFASLLIGLVSIPIFNIDTEGVRYFKIFIAILAIILISIESKVARLFI